jgi:hypothetical protein
VTVVTVLRQAETSKGYELADFEDAWKRYVRLPQSSELQEKLAAVKQVAAENKQKLHQYQWIETTQLTLKGDQKPPH